MATASVTASLRGRCVLVCLLPFLVVPRCVLGDIPVVTVDCSKTIDLRAQGLKSGLIVSDLPARLPIYPNEDQRCDMILSVQTGFEMMIYFDWLDLHSSDRSRCDSTNIELFDGSDNRRVGGLESPICGRLEEMPTGVYYVVNHMLIIRANSNGEVLGSGFRIHFTIYRRTFPCSQEEFTCETVESAAGSLGTRRCIPQELVCDDYNDCGDWVDEQQNCNIVSDGAIAAMVLTVIGLLALLVGLIILCKFRRSQEIRRYGEKEASAVMRDTSFSSGRGGFTSPFSISNETMEKDRYIPRYNTGRNSGRKVTSTRGPEEELPPPYSEKPALDDTGSELSEEEEAPRPRKKSVNRDADEVFEEDEGRRSRRGKSQNGPREDRQYSRDDRQPSRRDERDSPRSDRYSRDRDDRNPPRDDRYPSRRDDQDRDRDRPASRHGERDREGRDRQPSRYDDRDRGRENGRDRTSSRYNDRDRERTGDRRPNRYDDRERDRDRAKDRPQSRLDDKDPVSRRERPTSHHGDPNNRQSSDDVDDSMDQLHPLRDLKRRSMHTDSDPDSSKEDRRRSPNDRSYDEDRYQPDDERNHRPRDRDSRQAPKDDCSRRDDLYPPRDRDDRSSPRESADRPRDDRPRDRGTRNSSRDDRSDRRRETPSSRADDSYEDVAFRGRPSRRDSPPPADNREDSPPRQRRRRSRSREGQDRPRSSRYGDDRGGDDEARRSRPPPSGFKEESV